MSAFFMLWFSAHLSCCTHNRNQWPYIGNVVRLKGRISNIIYLFSFSFSIFIPLHCHTFSIKVNSTDHWWVDTPYKKIVIIIYYSCGIFALSCNQRMKGNTDDCLPICDLISVRVSWAEFETSVDQLPRSPIWACCVGLQTTLPEIA